MKVYKVPDKYKFPKGQAVAEVREVVFCEGMRPAMIKSCCIPMQCVNGWFVVDMVQTDDKRIILTLAKPE